MGNAILFASITVAAGVAVRLLIAQLPKSPTLIGGVVIVVLTTLPWHENGLGLNALIALKIAGWSWFAGIMTWLVVLLIVDGLFDPDD